MKGFTGVRLAATGNVTAAPANSGAVLWTVNVGTGAASAVVTIYDGTSTSGTVVTTIDASAKGSYVFGRKCNNGIHVVLSGGNADITVCYA